jgi:uncharacterized protein YegL
MRRLPIYLVIDTSYSMSGEPIVAVRNGIQSLLVALRQDPYALETAFISVITFSTEAKQVVSLRDVVSFQEPDIEADGTTALGSALDLLSDKLTNEVNIKSVDGKKGDWRPLVFLMTDGNPTDDWEKSLPKFKEMQTGIVVACAVGHSVDMDVLKSITDNVVQIDESDSSAFAAFFKWVSDSIKTTSQKVDLTKKDTTDMDELPPPPEEINVVT